jgi:Zn-finger nucleic acid-binding protein
MNFDTPPQGTLLPAFHDRGRAILRSHERSVILASMPDAGALHCPNCGGPAAPGDAACKYCHAQLATVSCPSCFALMFEGAVYCPSCGTRRARTAGSPAQAPCPSCRGKMQDVQVGDTAMLECTRCHAVWVDAVTFEHICANGESQAAVLHQWTGTPASAKSASVSYRKCVACGKMMNRINYGRLSGTIVDVCKGHGTFLDAGELHAIVRFIQGGGLDRARQRQIEDLKDQEQQLRQAQMLRDHGSDSVKSEPTLGLDLLSLLDHLRK